MRTQEKTKAHFKRKRICRTMLLAAPNQGGVALDNRGFTMVELIVVCAIIGILATMAVPAYHDLSLMAKNAGAKADISTLNKAVTAYFIDQNKLPNQLTDIGMQANIKDPWHHSYQYFNIGTGTGDGSQYKDYNTKTLNDDFDLYSLGVDGATAYVIPDPTDPAISTSRDDIVRAANGYAIDLASEY